jgi:ubiquinone/menaquinone biosynthesis C-methylase UbiE
LGVDTGTGRGIFIKCLSKKCKYVVGIDIHARLPEVKKELGSNVKNFDLACANICHMPFKDSQFDVITAIGVLEHIKETNEAIKECRRILRKNGILLVSLPVENEINYIKRKLLGIKHTHVSSEQIIKIINKFFGKVFVRKFPSHLPFFYVIKAR